MPTLRDAADLLAAARCPASLAALAAALHFTDHAQPVDAAGRERLGLPATLDDVHLVKGPGTLRALLFAAPPDAPLRDQLARVASALAAGTSHVLWVVLAVAGDEVGIACWTGERTPPRVVALVASRRRIVPSDAETLVAMLAVEGDDLLVHARWCEILGRDALTRRFYRTLEQRVNALAQSLAGLPAAEAAELALLTASRLLFLCFLQGKGWLNGERAFLAARFDECMARRGGFHARVLLPLFFGTLNTPMRRRAPVARAFGQVPFLNGGLFSRTPLERRHPRAFCSDEAIGQLFAQLLDAYRFTAREDDQRWSEVAIDPEMLGRAFESLMARRDRATTGAFYTPQPLVAHLADAALATALADGALEPSAILRLIAGEAASPAVAESLRGRLAGFTVLDPACGSGAFLVHLLERLTALHHVAGDGRATSVIRREVLARAIHGVDVNPTAVWLCELRLWLCVVIESGETRMSAVTPLPNLDSNVRVGDSLSGEAFAEPSALLGPSSRLVRLRARYARAAGASKAPLRRALAREERQRALASIDRAIDAIAGARRERVLSLRSPDLFGIRHAPGAMELQAVRTLRNRATALRRERRRLVDGGALPFAFPSHFGHVHARGGFDLVVGNPPWVRLHNIPAAARQSLRERFESYRDASWQPALPDVEPIRGFGAQVDLSALFVERSLGLLRTDGVVALLLPAKLWRSLSGGGMRRLLTRTSTLHRLEDWSGAPATFDAAVYPSLVVAVRQPPQRVEAAYVLRRRDSAVDWRGPAGSQRFDSDVASPWLMLPPDARGAFDLLRAAGPPLGGCALGRATLGVKCGCNDAFTVDVVPGEETPSSRDDRLVVEHLGRRGSVERALLRPLLRGDALTPWTVPRSTRSILWTHTAGGAPLPFLPAGAARWLAPWRRRLAARSDLRGERAWWSLFRTEAADDRRPRVVWGDLGRAPRAAILPAGESTVPLNSCYVLGCDDIIDALALTALFNSPLAAAWLNVIAEPARGGWHRYLAWTISLLPLPGDWHRARGLLAPLAERALLGTPPDDAELTATACEAYRVRRMDVAALLGWEA